MRKKQKHHTDELKSVWNLVMSSDWLTLELYCFIIVYERQTKDKPSKGQTQT